MKMILNILLIVNTIYILICSENTDVSVFFLPALIYIIVGALRIYHKEFFQFLNTPK